MDKKKSPFTSKWWYASNYFPIFKGRNNDDGINALCFGKNILASIGTGKYLKCLQKSLEHPQKFLVITGYGLVFFKNPYTARIKISFLWLGKIWQVYKGCSNITLFYFQLHILLIRTVMCNNTVLTIAFDWINRKKSS